LPTISGEGILPYLFAQNRGHPVTVQPRLDNQVSCKIKRHGEKENTKSNAEKGVPIEVKALLVKDDSAVLVFALIDTSLEGKIFLNFQASRRLQNKPNIDNQQNDGFPHKQACNHFPRGLLDASWYLCRKEGTESQ
jgi:hypothetical protein